MGCQYPTGQAPLTTYSAPSPSFCVWVVTAQSLQHRKETADPKGSTHTPVSRMVGQVLASTVAAASLDLSSRMMACVVSTHADLLTCRMQG